VGKVFSPNSRANRDNEVIFLEALHKKLPVDTPQLVNTGEVSGWPYIIMEQLPGITLEEAWPELDKKNKLSLCQKIGEATFALHHLPIPLTIENNNTKFLDWYKGQRAIAATRQASNGLDNQWVDSIEPFLQSVDMNLDETTNFVLLHTELMRDHFLVIENEDGWQLSGLIDFEPSMAGPAEYDFASVGLFISQGEPEILRAFMEGYGLENPDFNWKNRMAAWALQHRYAHFPWYLSRLPEGIKITNSQEFAEYYYQWKS
jgi:hygromycin-B 7''-O-kinase